MAERWTWGSQVAVKKRAIKQKEKQFIPHFKFIKQSIQFPALSLLRPRLRLLGTKELL